MKKLVSLIHMNPQTYGLDDDTLRYYFIYQEKITTVVFKCLAMKYVFIFTIFIGFQGFFVYNKLWKHQLVSLFLLLVGID